MEVVNSTLLEEVAEYVSQHISNNVADYFVYHDLQHTLNVVEAVIELSPYFDLSDKEYEALRLASWFHDVGYDEGPDNHEKRSAAHARRYLTERNYPEEGIQQIEACILATKLPSNPQSVLEQIICDADLNHLGKKNYWDRCGRVRQELTKSKDMLMSDKDWVDFELTFMNKHHWYTSAAKAMYGKRKLKHLRQLMKQKKRLDPDGSTFIAANSSETREEAKKKKKAKEKAISSVELKQLNLGRGVETMYRTTYRTHVNLSSIADNKANIMLSINAVVISIVLSSLVPRLSEMPKLIIPTTILLIVCLIAIVFATLSTRPKITEGRLTREDIENKKSNLLFFGNFYNMPLEDFHWGMMEMIKDSDFLYSSMTRDLYYLGIVLAKKYRYLRICYTVFMYGLILAVASFAIIFMFT